MRARAASDLPAPRIGAIRVAGTLVALAMAAAIALAPQENYPLREAWFDLNQRIAPRTIAAMPATIVEIDAKSLAALGRWPWPRSVLAELVERIAAHRPAALGIDVMMPEPDPLSPERLLQRRSGPAAPADGLLVGLPTNDASLARALANSPAVLAVAGLPEPTGAALRAAPFVLRDAAATGNAVDASKLRIAQFAGALTSVEEINRAASGWGLVSADPAGGVIRRVPLVASIDGTLIGAMGLEMFRVASRRSSLQLFVSDANVDAVGIGDARVPTEPDGSVRLYLSPRDGRRFVSAVDVLEDRVDPERLQDKLVLVGVTGLGLADFHHTPAGERMPGSEIHSQLIENLYEGSLLGRPAWAPPAEAVAFLLFGALLVGATPFRNPGAATLLVLAGLAALLGIAHVAFRSHRWLLDAATPALGLALLFASLLVLSLTEAGRHRRALEHTLQRQRERAARMAGELDAARRVQLATLPRAESLCDARLDLAAAMQPAREVGGDLYDFFRLDERRVFLLVGDVAGKGLSASIFMAVSKALYKSAALRAVLPDMGALMAAANAEISRDNPQMLFVTAFAAVLDLDSGAITYCNAGHENPLLARAGDPEVRRIEDGDGPPLCAVDDFAYRGAASQLRAGELVCIVSDGVTEAQDPSGAFYGRARLDALLLRLSEDARSARDIVDAVLSDVADFAAGAEASDDITVLALRWSGPDTIRSATLGRATLRFSARRSRRAGCAVRRRRRASVSRARACRARKRRCCPAGSRVRRGWRGPPPRGAMPARR